MTAPQEKAIREALEAGPTPGVWYIGPAHTDDAGYVELPIQADINGKLATAAVVCLQFPRVPGMQDANAKHIVACSPANIAALLAQLAELRAEVERLKALVPAPPKQPEPMFWFMRDNHTFRRLSGTPEEMVAQCLEEFDSGWTFGSLFAKGLADKHFGVHASGSANREDFRTNALAALAAIENGGANV